VNGHAQPAAIPFWLPASVHSTSTWPTNEIGPNPHDERETTTSNNATSILVEDEGAVRAVLDG
jgi:hypothetical protein